MKLHNMFNLCIVVGYKTNKKSNLEVLKEMCNKKDLSLAIRSKDYFLSNEVITYRQKEK